MTPDDLAKLRRVDLLDRRTVVAGLTSGLALWPVGSAHADDGWADLASFRAHVLALLQTHRPHLKPLPAGRGEPGKIQFEGRTDQVVHLDNLLARVRALDPDDRAYEILTFFDAIVGTGAGGELPETFSAARLLLRLQVVPSEYHTQNSSGLLHRPLSRYLVIGYAIDLPRQILLINPRQLRSWQVQFDTVHATAMENMERLSAQTPIDVVNSPLGSDRLALIEGDDGYNASRLLVRNFMQRVRNRLDTDIAIVAIPTRDLLIAWAPQHKDRVRLALTAKRFFETGAYPRSPELFVSDLQGVTLAPRTLVESHGLL